MTLPPVLPDVRVRDLLWRFAATSEVHAVLILSRGGSVTWANSGAYSILGADLDSLPGIHVSEFFSRRDAEIGIPEHELEEAFQRGRASDDRWMVRQDKTRFWAAGFTFLLDKDDPDCTYIKIFRNFTEMKMQLETAREQALASRTATDQLTGALALLAHELRNPLSAMGLGAEVLSRRLDQDDKAKATLAGISSNVSLAARLIEDLMQHSKVGSNGFSLERSYSTLRELLETCVAVACRQMEQDQRTISLLVPSGEIEVHVDRMRMQQVFVNLVANALRYTPEPGRIWVTATLEGTEVIVRVTDEGVGIEPDRLEHLFELFSLPRLSGSKLGLGIGLTLVKKIVALHGGSVQAHSEGPNRGSQFVVRFPVAG